MTDPIAHVVANADADARIFQQNRPSGAECIDMHVFLTSKYGCRVLLAAYLIQIIMISVSTEPTFGFFSFVNLLVTFSTSFFTVLLAIKHELCLNFSAQTVTALCAHS